MSMSLDGFVGSDREHPGIAIPEGVELKQWKLDGISKAGAHLMGRVTYQEMSSYWPRQRGHLAGNPSRTRGPDDRDRDHQG
jgi:dihydrofolate reductase